MDNQMKTILTSVALFLGLSTGAFAKDLAQYSFDHVGGNGVREIDTLTLSDTGVATIERAELGMNEPFGGDLKPLKTIRKSLAKEVFQSLKYKIQTLSTAELEVMNQRVVCMMMPMPGADRSLLVARDYDYAPAPIPAFSPPS